MTWIRRARKETHNVDAHTPCAEKNENVEDRQSRTTENLSKVEQLDDNQTIHITTENDNNESSALKDKQFELILQNVSKIYEISDDPKFAVYSMPERPLSEEEIERKKEMVKLRVDEISNAESENIDCQLLATSTLSLEDKFIFDLIPKRMGKLELQNKLGEQGSSQSPEKLLYPPSAVQTDQQRSIQIVLLKQISRDMSNSFNKRFLALRSEKLDVLDYIRKSNNEINAICEKFGYNLDNDRFKILHDRNIDVISTSLKEDVFRDGSGGAILNRVSTPAPLLFYHFTLIYTYIYVHAFLRLRLC